MYGEHIATTPLCPTAGCSSTVSVVICRGTTNPEHAGYYYERCNAPGPFSHWLRWRWELGRHMEAIRHLPAPSMLEAMQLPRTPVKVPPLYPTTSSTPCQYAPVALSALTFPGAGTVLGDSTPTTEPLPPPPSTTPSFDAFINSIDRSHTRTLVVDGKIGTFCNGPRCRENVNKKPVAFAQKCTNQFCLKCCSRFQEYGGPECALKAHRPSPLGIVGCATALLLESGGDNVQGRLLSSPATLSYVSNHLQALLKATKILLSLFHWHLSRPQNKLIYHPRKRNYQSLFLLPRVYV